MQMKLPSFLDFSSSVFIAECGKVGVTVWQKCYSTSTVNSQDNVCMEGMIHIHSTYILKIMLRVAALSACICTQHALAPRIEL